MAVFSFVNNNDSSVYFTVETVRNDQGFYEAPLSPTNAVGVYSNFTGVNASHLVTSSYIFSEIIPPGSSSFEFIPTASIATGSVYFRGTGDLTVTVTV
jgi:hypothetical protein